MAKLFLSIITIFLPFIMGGNSSAGVTVRPGSGVYPVETPVTVILEDVHMCAWIAVQVEGLEPGEYLTSGGCDTGVGVAEVRVLVPAKVGKITLTPYWFNGDPGRLWTALTKLEFTGGEK